MTTSELSECIKAEARALGFSHVGITRAEALTEEAARLRDWLARGYHGTMEWMARASERRIDPRVAFPEARSVIVTAMNYYTSHTHSDDPEVGKISRYAWGTDYHEVVGARLLRLLEGIQARAPEVGGKVYVDTGPMMEKAWAVRAGIGWLGKHTNLITRDRGSWVFLGELLVNVALAYDTPMEDFCGTCTACIDACPTSAIVGPAVLDSRRCISYLTIEHRGDISEEFQPHMGGWVFGCDICQDVCPWNRFASETDEVQFHPRPENVRQALDDLTEMTPETFREQFHHSAVRRTRLTGLRRNAAVARRRRSPEPAPAPVKTEAERSPRPNETAVPR